MENYSIEITPDGLKSAPVKLKSRWENFKNDLTRVKFIVKSELQSRIFDKSLGIFWLLLEPIILAVIYYLLTKVIFKASMDRNLFLIIFTSVIFWRWFGKSVDASPSIFTGYGSILKQTNFSVHLVLFSFLGIEFILLLFNLSVLIVFLFFNKIYISYALIFLPVIMVVQFVFSLWLVLIFSILGTFIKDIGGILYAFTSIWWFMSPGIYPVSKVPQEYLWIYMMNPFAHLLPAYADVLIHGKLPPLQPLLIIFAASTLFSLLCLKILKKYRYYFFTFL